MGLLSRVKRKFRSAWTDLRYGAILKGKVASPYSHLGAVDTEHTGYDILPPLFANQVRPGDVLVNIGCGKGRVLNWWLDNHRSHRMYGIELDPAVAERTRDRLKRFSNVTILTGDACVILPDDASLLYMFHPFNAQVMQRFITTILKTPIAQGGLPRRIVYYNSQHLDLFEAIPNFTVRRVDGVPTHHKSAVIDYKGN